MPTCQRSRRHFLRTAADTLRSDTPQDPRFAVRTKYRGPDYPRAQGQMLGVLLATDGANVTHVLKAFSGQVRSHSYALDATNARIIRARMLVCYSCTSCSPPVCVRSRGR